MRCIKSHPLAFGTKRLFVVGRFRHIASIDHVKRKACDEFGKPGVSSH
jgi:hypothetical protein